MQRLCMVA